MHIGYGMDVLKLLNDDVVLVRTSLTVAASVSVCARAPVSVDEICARSAVEART